MAGQATAGALRKALAGGVGPAWTCGCCLELRLNSTQWGVSCQLPWEGTDLGGERPALAWGPIILQFNSRGSVPQFVKRK